MHLEPAFLSLNSSGLSGYPRFPTEENFKRRQVDPDRKTLRLCFQQVKGKIDKSLVRNRRVEYGYDNKTP